MLANEYPLTEVTHCNIKMALCLENGVNYALLNLRYIWYCTHVTDQAHMHEYRKMNFFM
jgi:hypothetical protein